MKKIGMFLAAIALIGTLSTACGGSNTGDTAATASESASQSSPTEVAGAPTITIADMAFGRSLTVAPGTQINIVNTDTVEHSVTSETDGAFDVHINGGTRKTLTAPMQPGEYPFYCVYHPNMKGTLTVR